MNRYLAHLILSVTFAGAFACAAANADSGKRAITHEDLWLMQRLSSPALSPDGKLAVVVVTRPAYDPAQQSVDLWLVPTDGKTSARQLTFNKEPEATPAFSPDGRRIAFSAQRSGDSAAQIYVLDLGGGEAQRVSSISTGARTPRFSPDGQSILFVSGVFPETMNDADNQRVAGERKARKYNARVYTGFPIRNWDRWLDDRRQRLFVQPISGGQARDLLAGSTLVSAPGFGGRFTDTGEEIDAAWAPDGKSVIFAASTNRHSAAYAFTHTDLFEVALKGGEPRRLTGAQAAAGDGSWSLPAFSADGKTLYAQLTPRTDRIYNASRLAAIEWPSARLKSTLTPPDARSVNTFATSSDGRSVFFSAEDAGLERIYRAGPNGKTDRLSLADTGTFTNLLGARRGAQVLIAIRDSATSPQELVRIDAATGNHIQLTNFSSAGASALDLPPVEHFWTSNAAGSRIHNMLLRPAGFDPEKKYPLLVLMHGGPHTMWRDQFVLRWNYHLLAGSDFVVLLTNYSGSTGFGEKFAQAIQGDPLKGPGEEINHAADEAIKRFAFVDGQRQCAGGASYGGHLANWLQASTTRYRCLISHAGLVNLEAQWGTSDSIYGREVTMGGPPWQLPQDWSAQNPISFADKFRTPVLVSVGEQDFRVPLNNTLEYWSALQRQQVESRLLVFPDENHWILKGENSRYFYAELDQWLRRWLLEADGGSAGN